MTQTKIIEELRKKVEIAAEAVRDYPKANRRYNHEYQAWRADLAEARLALLKAELKELAAWISQHWIEKQIPTPLVNRVNDLISRVWGKG